MMTIDQVFATDSRCGWQANAADIAASCPVEFYSKNDWSAAASKLFGSPSPHGWKWKSPDPKQNERHHLAILCLLSSFWIEYEYKLAIAGWMLSKILHSPP